MIKKAKILVFLFFAFLLLSSISFAQQREIPPVKLEKISDNLFQILDGRGANGGFYIGDNGVLVIDSKMTKESVDQTLAEIKKITNKPIKYLVNTHSDGDHIAGNPFFPPSVIIIAHEKCREEFLHPRRDGKPSEWSDPKMAPYLPTLTYRDKMDIYLGEKKVELRYFGVGHTKGDTVVYFPEEKTAFLGDQIFMGRPQLIHSYKGGNSFAYVKTMTKMLENIDAETFCSGHGDPIDRNAVKHHIAEMKSIQAKVKSIMEQNKSLEDVKKEFPENHSRLVESIFNELKTMS
ncbi:MAG: MBL fold metallo-hydrolase [Candidatus Aminicenantes bacterium]|nr:MAG: MBL fold metallo-hydrolase [Candidatus Aminicenantes bacterium]